MRRRTRAAVQSALRKLILKREDEKLAGAPHHARRLTFIQIWRDRINGERESQYPFVRCAHDCVCHSSIKIKSHARCLSLWVVKCALSGPLIG